MSIFDRNPAYDGPMGIFDDYEGCDSGIDTTPILGFSNGEMRMDRDHDVESVDDMPKEEYRNVGDLPSAKRE